MQQQPTVCLQTAVATGLLKGQSYSYSLGVLLVIILQPSTQRSKTQKSTPCALATVSAVLSPIANTPETLRQTEIKAMPRNAFSSQILREKTASRRNADAGNAPTTIGACQKKRSRQPIGCSSAYALAQPHNTTIHSSELTRFVLGLCCGGFAVSISLVMQLFSHGFAAMPC